MVVGGKLEVRVGFPGNVSKKRKKLMMQEEGIMEESYYEGKQDEIQDTGIEVGHREEWE